LHSNKCTETLFKVTAKVVTSVQKSSENTFL